MEKNDKETIEMLLAENKILKEKVLKSEKLNEAIVENATDAMVSVDYDGFILSWNPAAERMLGFQSNEIVGKSIFEIISNKFEIKRQILQGYFTQGHRKHIAKNFELLAIRKDGKEIPVELSFSDWQLRGNTYFVFGIRDITERKSNEFLLRKLDLAMKNSNDIVIMTDPDGIITYVNPQFTKTYGYTACEVIGRFTPRVLKGCNDDDRFKLLWQTLKNKKSFKMSHYQNKRKDGSLIDLESTIDPILDSGNNVIGYLGIQHDISKRIKYIAELEAAIEKGRESDKLKSEFLATMSHELRTPLNAIIGLSGLIDADSPMNEILEYNQIIHKNGEHLLKLIEDLFNISLIESGKVKIHNKKIGLADLFDDVYLLMKDYQNTIGKNHIKFNLKIPSEYKHITIYIDELKLKHILINLLKNAFKFSENGDVNLGFNVCQEDGKVYITFFVSDTGIGIEEAHYDLIFKGFTQVNNSYNRLHEGLGIGLTIVKKLVKLLDGNIWIDSAIGKGSTFFFCFPIINSESQNVNSDGFTAKLLRNF
ncbi:PAS domain S-box protein [Mariniflexile sp.]|uniref:sensor histidine kinase n=1 Tax=Mariniflexile sp. TaxID=1979402 RepID=UPI003564E987